MTFIDISGCVLSNINSKKLQGLDFFSQFFLQCRYLKCAPYFGSSLLFSSVFGLVLNFFGELLLFSVSVESGTDEFVSDKGQDDGDGDLFFSLMFSQFCFSQDQIKHFWVYYCYSVKACGVFWSSAYRLTYCSIIASIGRWPLNETCNYLPIFCFNIRVHCRRFQHWRINSASCFAVHSFNCCFLDIFGNWKDISRWPVLEEL